MKCRITNFCVKVISHWVYQTFNVSLRRVSSDYFGFSVGLQSAKRMREGAGDNKTLKKQILLFFLKLPFFLSPIFRCGYCPSCSFCNPASLITSPDSLHPFLSLPSSSTYFKFIICLCHISPK